MAQSASQDAVGGASAGGDRPEWMMRYDSREVARRFANPPMFYAPHTFWFWDDVIKNEHLAADMATEMARQRLNPGYAHPRSGFSLSAPGLPVEQYLAQPWFNSFGNALHRAKELGLTFSYCDDYNWPSGQAAGKVLQQHPELQALYLSPKRHAVVGKTEVRYDSIDFAVAARLDSEGLIDASTLRLIGQGRTVSWKVPAGNWVVYTYTLKHHPGIDGGRVNYLDPRLMEAFIPLVHEQYARRFGNDMGRTMPGVFVDNEGDFGWKMAWSDHLAQRYREKKGRDIRLWLPLLTEKDKDGLFVVARHDWFDVVSDVYNECYFRPLVTWLKERNMYYISNLWEESLQLQATGVGDLMRTTRMVTMPGNDCLDMVSQDVHDFKEVQTVAELEGRPFMSEIMGVAGWVQTPAMMKMTVNSITSFGVSHIVPHGIYMNRKLETLPFPADWYTENPYWNYLHLWTDFARRASFVTRQSSLVADVLLLTPLENIWAFSENYFRDEPDTQTVTWDAHVEEINRVHSDAMRRMNASNIDFLIADKHYLDQGDVHSSDKGATITIKHHSFKAMVLPPAYVMPQSVMQKVYEFAKQGGLVVVLGELPQGSPEVGLKDKAVKKLSAALSRLPNVVNVSSEADRMGAMIRALKNGTAPQLRLENAGRLYTAQRRMGDTQLYWFANNTDTLKHFTAWLRDAKGEAEIWNCETGEKVGLASQAEEGYTKISLSLNPYEAYWVVFNPEAKSVAQPAPRQTVIGEQTLDAGWTISYPDANVVSKSTAKVCYSDDLHIDSAKLKTAYDDAAWGYFSRQKEESDKSRYAYWRMNIPLGAKSVVVPSYLMGQAVCVDDAPIQLTDSLLTLPQGSRLISFALPHGEKKLAVSPFKFTVGTVENASLDSWYSYGLQQYSGFLDYETSVTLTETSPKVYLDLGEVKYMAEVFVNGTSVGARLWPPFKLDISEYLRPGENKIKVRIGNLIANEIWIKDDMGKLREWNWAWKADPDLSQYSAGVWGPVRLLYVKEE